MIAVEDCVLVLLAAGRSRRMGDIGSKLDAPFLGRPLGLHVAVALEDMPFRERVAVVGGADCDYAAHGFTIVRNDDPQLGMSRSLALGVDCARARGVKAVVVALADMPRVTATHIYQLLDAADDEDAIVASSDGHAAKPPAVFGAGRFDALVALEGDAGARDMVRAGKHVVTTPAELIDVDTPEELERLRELVGAPEAYTRRRRTIMQS
ncbi:nucleotidyltransferase family protein [Sphingomonas sp. RP10(2022)]|uniref:Nucleotidyltransferase family protein n=1 Tax=Sphingomonas liriopis TaxID=2949094 RepID=A0A9X2HR42_9SPHN|nr:nucleotidyltransferase family protein [Sphingomonas liriopis]MCP3734927.1 nucleotidyltransferase family protein [Sphingomonas liriopis]